MACIVLALLYFQVRTYAPTSADVDLTPKITDIILHLGYLVPFFNGQWILEVFWTLAVEFQYYLVVSLLLPFVLTGSSKAYRYCFYMIFLVAPFMLRSRDFSPVHAPLFLIGILYTFLQTKIIESRECLWLTLLSVIVSVLVSPVSHSIAGLSTILIINFPPNLTHPVLEFLGKISYSLYLLHQITGKALINILSHKFNAGYQITILIITGYLFSVISAWVFYKIIENPAQRMSGKIKYNRTFIAFKKQDV